MSLALSDATPFGAEWAVLRSLTEVRFGLMEGRHTRSNRAAMLAALDELAATSPEVRYMVDFVRAAKEGVHGA